MKCVSGEGEHFNTREEKWAKKLTAGGHWVRQVEEVGGGAFWPSSPGSKH